MKHTNQRENADQKKRVFFEADIYRNTRNIIDRSHENFGSNYRENGDEDQEEFSQQELLREAYDDMPVEAHKAMDALDYITEHLKHDEEYKKVTFRLEFFNMTFKKRKNFRCAMNGSTFRPLSIDYFSTRFLELQQAALY